MMLIYIFSLYLPIRIFVEKFLVDNASCQNGIGLFSSSAVYVEPIDSAENIMISLDSSHSKILSRS